MNRISVIELKLITWKGSVVAKGNSTSKFIKPLSLTLNSIDLSQPD